MAPSLSMRVRDWIGRQLECSSASRDGIDPAASRSPRGNADLAITLSLDEVAVLFSDGLGGFGAPVPLPVPGLGCSIVAESLDGDVHVDLAAGGDWTVHVWRNQGDGTFTELAEAPLPFGGPMPYLSAADLDSDADVDLVASGLFILVNDGAASFEIDDAWVGAGARTASADFDGDGDVDVAETDRLEGDVCLLANDGTLQFAASRHSEHVGEPTTLADLDSDGSVDMVGAISVYQELRATLNDSTGRFGPYLSTLVNGDFFRAALPADFDCDGDLDVAVAESWTFQVFDHDGAGNLRFDEEIVVGGSLWSAVAADLDGDGWTDLAGANFNEIDFVANDGAGGFDATVVTPTGDFPDSLVAGDLDGDGDVDLACAELDDFARDAIGVFENDGLGTFDRSTRSAGDQINLVRPGDIDGDDDLDVVTYENDAGLFVIVGYRNDGSGTFEAGEAIADFASSISDHELADLDFDGDIDIALTANARGLVLLVNDGTGAYSEGLVLHHDDFGGLELADLDGDGSIDIVTEGGSMITFANP